jgi:hypothetical protein
MPLPDRVLRFPRSDEAGAFVLIHVSQNSSAPFDLTLTATEGESPYISLCGSLSMEVKGIHGLTQLGQ